MEMENIFAFTNHGFGNLSLHDPRIEITTMQTIPSESSSMQNPELDFSMTCDLGRSHPPSHSSLRDSIHFRQEPQTTRSLRYGGSELCIGDSSSEDRHHLQLNPHTTQRPVPVNASPYRAAKKQGANQASSQMSSTPGSPYRGSDQRDLSMTSDGTNNIYAADLRPLTPTYDGKDKKRRSWLPGRSASGSPSVSDNQQIGEIWTIASWGKTSYNIVPLCQFKPVSELWDEDGDTLIYLHDRRTGHGPSFRVSSTVFASSRALVRAAHGHVLAAQQAHKQDHDKIQSGDAAGARSYENSISGPGNIDQTSSTTSWSGSHRSSSSGYHQRQTSLDKLETTHSIHLCLPQPLQNSLSDQHHSLTASDLDTIVICRNLFAFLYGMPLVATTRQPMVFDVLMNISHLLHRYEFSNLDGSSMGEEVEARLAQYNAEFRLADVRNSREKIIEALMLGERMQNWKLYNEGFAHAVGRYNDLAAFKSPKKNLIDELTWKRLERSTLFLSTRLRNVNAKLDDFDFPALLSSLSGSAFGFGNKTIQVRAWKTSFLSMRRHVMCFYKERYGSWPPKAKSKKNNFEEGGLNRLLLKQVYQDMCDLYDVLVDSTNITTRQSELPTQNETYGTDESLQRTLRKILNEYDRSVPPTQPAIPFDTPRLPSLSNTRRDFDKLEAKKQMKECAKRLKDSEINTALMQSYNRDLMKSTAFLEAFFDYERLSAHHKSIEDIAELRIGQWIFLYAVIQSLPLVVVDAPGLQHTDGVEYFLSEFCKEPPPWMRLEQRQKMTWRIPGSDVLVDMPAASVEHSIDAIYQRSHCWQMAQAWLIPPAEHTNLARQQQYDVPYEDLLPPIISSAPHSRSGSRSSNDRASVILLQGLQQLPVPSHMPVAGASSGIPPHSFCDPATSFAMILGNHDGNDGECNTTSRNNAARGKKR